MVDEDIVLPSTKKAQKNDTSVDVHGAEASAPSEQQTGEAAAPSQQENAQIMFGVFACISEPSAFSCVSRLYCLIAGAGLQGPAGVRTDFPPMDDQPMTSHGDVDLEPAAAERPEGIIGPSGKQSAGMQAGPKYAQHAHSPLLLHASCYFKEFAEAYGMAMLNDSATYATVNKLQHAWHTSNLLLNRGTPRQYRH